jgi:hypothetical protein
MFQTLRHLLTSEQPKMLVAAQFTIVPSLMHLMLVLCISSYLAHFCLLDYYVTSFFLCTLFELAVLSYEVISINW